MLHFTLYRKTLAATVMAAAIILILSSFSTIAHSETVNNFTVPDTINTYGNAWNGELSFDLSQNTDYSLVIMNTNGTVLSNRESDGTYGPTYNLEPNTLLFEGEPQVYDPNTAWPIWSTHLLNLASNTTEDFPNVLSEHDIQYDPINNTFLTLQDYTIQVGNNSILTDKIVLVDSNGNELWSWDVFSHIPLSEASPYNQTDVVNGKTVEDFTHANDLDWDYNNGIIYLNLRNTNTFYKIDQTTGDIVWACGEFGNFTLLNAKGQQVSSLWYGSHDTKEVAPDVFTMFDNDFDNNTNPDNCHSQLLELTLNESSMTASVNWSWEAPIQYWNTYGGATVILPNGDYLGDFGDPSHQFPQNQPWSFNNTGAVLVEVNPEGQIVRTWTFPVGYYIYRVEAITNIANSTPTVSPTSTPPKTINSQTAVTATALIVAIVVIAILSIIFILKKRTIRFMKKDSNS